MGGSGEDYLRGGPRLNFVGGSADWSQKPLLSGRLWREGRGVETGVTVRADWQPEEWLAGEIPTMLKYFDVPI